MQPLKLASWRAMEERLAGHIKLDDVVARIEGASKEEKDSLGASLEEELKGRRERIPNRHRARVQF